MSSGQDEDEDTPPKLSELLPEDTTIDQLREILARQILKMAIDDDNAQYKLDAFKATEPKGRGTPRTITTAASPMAMFHERVRRAEGNGDGESTETD